jgi:hypothetical protein
MYVIFRSDPDLFWDKGRIRICFGEKVVSRSVLGKRSNPDLFWGKGRIRICFGNRSNPDLFRKKSNPDPYFEKDRIRIRIFKMVGSESGLNNQFF